MEINVLHPAVSNLSLIALVCLFFLPDGCLQGCVHIGVGRHQDRSMYMDSQMLKLYNSSDLIHEYMYHQSHDNASFVVAF